MKKFFKSLTFTVAVATVAVTGVTSFVNTANVQSATADIEWPGESW